VYIVRQITINNLNLGFSVSSYTWSSKAEKGANMIKIINKMNKYFITPISFRDCFSMKQSCAAGRISSALHVFSLFSLSHFLMLFALRKEVGMVSAFFLNTFKLPLSLSVQPCSVRCFGSS